MRVTLRVEDGDRYEERVLTRKELAALFDLQFMIQTERDVCSTLESNNMLRETFRFFRKLSFIYQISYNDVWMKIENGKRVVVGKNYSDGRPKWKKMD